MTARMLRWATGCVAAVAVALLASGVALSYADRHLLRGSGWDVASVVEDIAFVAVPVVGFVLASRRPKNRIGWLFLGMGLVLGLGFFCWRYGERGLAAPGTLPAARTAAWFQNWAFAIPIAGFAFLLLLFPTGRLISPRWRVAAWYVAGASALATAAFVVRAYRIRTAPYTALNQGWYPGSRAPDAIVFSAALLIGVAAVAVRFTRSSGDERLQLKWFMTAAALAVATLIPLAVVPQMGTVTSLTESTLKVTFSLALVCLYGAIAIAVLKYRLYDIDRVISRTLAYAILTGVLAVVYAGLVLLATQVLTITSQVAVAAATLAAAALFNPLRRRVQHLVDRRFNRARYDADRTLAGFAARLQDTTDPEAVRSDLIGTVQQALEPAHMAIWTAGPKLAVPYRFPADRHGDG